MDQLFPLAFATQAQSKKEKVHHRPKKKVCKIFIISLGSIRGERFEVKKL